MEPVSDEFVEQYGEFFFRLSDAQLKERIVEFKVKQPNLHKSISNMAIELRSPDKIEILWKLTLLITHCFESYSANKFMVSAQSIHQNAKDYERKVKTWKPENLEDSIFFSEIRSVNQQNLFDYIEVKLEYFDKQENVITQNDAAKIVYSMIILGQLYLRTILRY